MSLLVSDSICMFYFGGLNPLEWSWVICQQDNVDTYLKILILPSVYEHSAETFTNIYIILITDLWGGCCCLSLQIRKLTRRTQSLASGPELEGSRRGLGAGKVCLSAPYSPLGGTAFLIYCPPVFTTDDSGSMVGAENKVWGAKRWTINK